MKVILHSQETNFETEIELADNFFKRFNGLMFRKRLAHGHGLLLRPCSGIHTCFMRFPIDVIYLDSDNTVLGQETLLPWHIGKHIKGAKAILELNAGEAIDVLIGEQLSLLRLVTENS